MITIKQTFFLAITLSFSQGVIAEDSQARFFLSEFPDSFKRFNEVYGYTGDKMAPLYERSYEDVNNFFELVTKSKYNYYQYKIVNISLGAYWDADAVNYFQSNLRSLISKKPLIACDLLKSRTLSERISFWSFYLSAVHLSDLDLSFARPMAQACPLVYNSIGAGYIQAKDDPSNEKSVFNDTAKEMRLAYIQDIDGYTNFRARPLLHADVIKQLENGTPILVKIIGSKWVLAEIPDGRSGYVFKDRIKFDSFNISWNEAKLKYSIKYFPHQIDGGMPSNIVGTVNQITKLRSAPDKFNPKNILKTIKVGVQLKIEKKKEVDGITWFYVKELPSNNNGWISSDTVNLTKEKYAFVGEKEFSFPDDGRMLSWTINIKSSGKVKITSCGEPMTGGVCHESFNGSYSNPLYINKDLDGFLFTGTRIYGVEGGVVTSKMVQF